VGGWGAARDRLACRSAAATSGQAPSAHALDLQSATFLSEGRRCLSPQLPASAREIGSLLLLAPPLLPGAARPGDKETQWRESHPFFSWPRC
jgi:hypothetical protein